MNKVAEDRRNGRAIDVMLSAQEGRPDFAYKDYDSPSFEAS